MTSSIPMAPVESTRSVLSLSPSTNTNLTPTTQLYHDVSLHEHQRKPSELVRSIGTLVNEIPGNGNQHILNAFICLVPNPNSSCPQAPLRDQFDESSRILRKQELRSVFKESVPARMRGNGRMLFGLSPLMPLLIRQISFCSARSC